MFACKAPDLCLLGCHACILRVGQNTDRDCLPSRLLRARHERPRRCRAAEERDEIAPFQLIKLLPPARAGYEDIELATISQAVFGKATAGLPAAPRNM
jgi:hypothetical protein